MKIFMSSKRRNLIKDLKLKREAFKRELESFEAVLDSYNEKDSINVIQNLLNDLEEEYIVFKDTQSELDDIDDGKTMQERIDLKKLFNTCKGRAQDIIETVKMQTSVALCLKEEETFPEKIWWWITFVAIHQLFAT
ncbi:uncharacterized protein LOC122571992 [Bombus pyrosoma]|uniref:uncharacterized protein LOC122571992 n=1 Tax=Bombus pyrosoma TaxID=396416 RepID=UPI001CB88C4A|nr:uncharacterized protein LOC122571992 [Bombus pyrosoma]